MIFKKHKLKLRDAIAAADTPNCKSEYSFAINLAKQYISSATSTPNKAAVLEHMMSMIRHSMQYDYLSKVLYDSGIAPPPSLMATHYFDEAGKLIMFLLDEATYVDISFETTATISFPWRTQKLFDCIPIIKKEGFKYDKDNHSATYYANMNVCIVRGGFHSSSIGIINNNGTIKAKLCNEEKLYRYVSTDGENWTSKITGKILEPCVDFRFATLYELSRMLFEIQHSGSSRD